MDIAGWLSSLGLGKYSRTFAKNEITPEHQADTLVKAYVMGIAQGELGLSLA